MLFSILIAQFNNGNYFLDCYKSILAQNYTHWEVIIVDDASTDKSVEQIREIIGNDDRFKLLINRKNEGCGYTKRRCAELARGEICAFLDPDDAITEDALAVMVEEHVKHPEASLIYSKPYICDEHLNIQGVRESKQIPKNDPHFFNFDGYVFHFLSYKKIFYDRTSGIDGYFKRAVDQDLVFRLYEKGECVFLDQALYLYRIHNGGISTHLNRDKAFFWHWVAIIDAAKRRNINVEQLFISHATKTRREAALELEIAAYNKSYLFKVFRKLGLFNI